MTAGEGDEGFRRVYDLLGQLVMEINEIRRRYSMVVAGPELTTLVAIETEEGDLDRDVHRLQRQLEAHGS